MATTNLTLTIKSKVYGAGLARFAARTAALFGASESAATSIGLAFVFIRCEIGGHHKWVWAGRKNGE